MAITHHYTKWGGGGSGKVEESGDTGLDKIMGTTAIDEDDDAVGSDVTIKAKGLRGRGTFHSVKANLGD